MCCSINRFCCMSLPAAGVVIGWLSISISLLQTIIYIATLANIDDIMVTVFKDFYKCDAESGMIGTTIMIIIAVHLALSLLDLVASILVIVGITRNSHLMLLPWLINNAVVLTCRLLSSFTLFLSFAVLDRDFKHAILAMVILIVLGIYCCIWTAIYSLFLSLSNEKQRRVEKLSISSSCDYEAFRNSEDENEKQF